MEVKVVLFAALRDTVGQEEIRIAWCRGMTGQDVMGCLKQDFLSAGPLLNHALIAVNGQYAEAGAFLMPGDEIAFLPPVSGG